MSRQQPGEGLLRIALLIAILVFFPLLLLLFALELLDVVLIWVATGATRVLPLAWAFALMLVLLLVFTGLGYVFTRTVESIAPRRPDPALEELRVAYARGEVSKDEFQERRELLRREKS